jgi:hypothetical protein
MKKSKTTIQRNCNIGGTQEEEKQNDNPEKQVT